MERGQGLRGPCPWRLEQPPRRPAGRRLAGLFHGRPRLQVGALLAGPVGWLVVGYLGSLAVLFVTSFWTLGELSGEIEQTFTLDNFRDVVDTPVYRAVAGRTIGIAALVTVTCALLAFPLAFYMAKLATPRVRGLLVVAVLMPLWSSYLVKVFAWRGILSEEGVFNWVLDPLRDLGPRLRDRRRLAGDDLHLAAVHGHPDLRGPRADPRHAAERLRGHGREAALHVPPGDPAARLPGRRRRLDLHLLAHARRLHRRRPDRLGRAVHRHPRLRQLHRQPAVRGRVRDRPRPGHDHLPAARPELGAFEHL